MQSDEVEEKGEEGRRFNGPLLSMRTKMALAGFCFFLIISTIAYVRMPYLVTALRGMALGEEPRVGYVTIFRDDLDSLDPSWYVWEESAGDVNSSNGYVFLNLGSGNSDISVSSITDLLGEWGMKWSYVAVEIRLRCGDDNGLLGGVGEGQRGWGFGDLYPDWPDNFLLFNSHSQGSGQSLVGFHACVGINGSMVRQENIARIDMREWHNYTILWMPNNATFLVDGEMVLTTEGVPNVPLAVCILTQNRRDDLLPDGKIELIDFIPLKQDQWIQIDYVHVFMGREEITQYSVVANQTLIAALRVLLSAELRGIDTQELMEDHAQATEALHQNGYIPAELNSRMVSIAETLPIYLEELSELFSRAEEKIQSLSLEGKETRSLEAQYDRAVKALRECEYPLAITYLEKITEDDSD